ncbi:OLC1v1034684C1 [Oldenlandia corymbosa var. corymbosa]|uniref:OLC1v1034684C1 n=1 Tax=Oldenlandia corymbosa var. corymbosa TaxID=529605 RepID=A0AAV1CRU8_OLDCO|nr:OLC1v1034684C1 [Oldenlandia corymbosa var. corymbosa]
MSSHDSMGLVFKCLSKGAVDFLVKPIRKNELKNLWQHVWRRCHSSSGSGSESGAPTQKSVHTRSSEKSGDSSSNAGENNGSNGLNNIDGSDDGSGTQSSWTKQPIEGAGSPATSPTNQVANHLDNKCAQVSEPNAEASSGKRVQTSAKKERPKEEQSGNCLAFLSTKSIHFSLRRCFIVPFQTTYVPDPLPDTTNNLDSEQNPLDVCARVTGAKPNSHSEVTSSRMGKEEERAKGKLHLSKHKVAEKNSTYPQTNSNEFDHPKEFTCGQEVKENPLDDTREKEIELSLKRLRGTEGSEKTIQDNSNSLKHSEHSAFSRYNTSTSSAKAPKAITGDKNVNSLEDVNRDSSSGHTNGNIVFPSFVGSNFIGVGSLTNTFPGNPIPFSSEAASTVNGFHPFSAFQPVKSDPRNIPPLSTQVKSVDMQASSVLSPTRGVQLELQDHHHHHLRNLEQEQILSNYEKSPMKKLVAEAAHSALLNVVGGPEAGAPENCCMKGSVSGSTYGSNGQSGSSSAVNTGFINGESGTLDGRIENMDANRSGFGNRIDENKLAQREAALLKFRQKRKERCFKKKVRYQNRKRLAEQRPRVRGQFVRQIDHGSSNDAASADE